MAPVPSRRRRSSSKVQQAGQGLVEYALILVLIAIISIAALSFFGAGVSGYLSNIGHSV